MAKFSNYTYSSLIKKNSRKKPDKVTVESSSPYLGPHILKEVEYVALAT